MDVAHERQAPSVCQPVPASCDNPECEGKTCGTEKTCQDGQCLFDPSICHNARGTCDISDNCYPVGTSGTLGRLGCPGSMVCCKAINLCKGAQGWN